MTSLAVLSSGDTANWEQRGTSANWESHWNRKKRETVSSRTLLFLSSVYQNTSGKIILKIRLWHHSRLSEGKGMWSSFCVDVIYSVLEMDVECLDFIRLINYTLARVRLGNCTSNWSAVLPEGGCKPDILKYPHYSTCFQIDVLALNLRSGQLPTKQQAPVPQCGDALWAIWSTDALKGWKFCLSKEGHHSEVITDTYLECQGLATTDQDLRVGFFINNVALGTLPLQQERGCHANTSSRCLGGSAEQPGCHCHVLILEMC